LSVSSDREIRTKIVKPKALSQAAIIRIKIANEGALSDKKIICTKQERIIASSLKRADKIVFR
jgi:hypothetical protein